MVDETPAPLSDAEIAEIEREIREWSVTGRISRTDKDVEAARAYVARLKHFFANVAALREIVAAVAGCPQGPDDFVILAISREMSNRARALLADTQTPATGATAGELASGEE